MRVGKTVNGTGTSFLQDQAASLPHVLIEQTGEQQTLYVWGLGLAIRANPDGTRRYYHTDALGSTRVVTDDSGQAVSGYNYDAYGSAKDQAGEGSAFGFTGEELDETAFVFLRARHYDPVVARFVQKDAFPGTAADPGSLNRWGYARGNPLVFRDPNGRFPWLVAIGLLMAGGVWMANPSPVNAPEDATLTVPSSSYGDMAFLDSAPGTGDVSDLFALVTERRLFTWECQSRTEAAPFAVVPGLTAGAIKYLRHTDPQAFEQLLALGAKDWARITTILRSTGGSTVIRTMGDASGSQIALTVGNNRIGLQHVIGRHLSGEIERGVETHYFSETLKVGDVVDIVAQTIRSGTKEMQDGGTQVYKWVHPTWGEIQVVANRAMEVVSAFPTKGPTRR